MPRRIFSATLSLLAATSCSFESDGAGVTAGLGSGVDEGSGGDSVGSDSTGAPESGDPSGGSSDEAESGTTAMAESSDDGPGSPARLVFVPEALDFGNIVADSDYVLELEVRNAGGSTATLVTEVLIPGAFGLSGGFPGAGGTCGTELGSGDSCTLAVGFHPNAIGPYLSNLDLSYYDGIDLGAPLAAPTVGLAGGGIGETGNLILNPSAEASLDSWMSMGSTWVATNQDAVAGAHAFEAGNPIGGTTTLVQTIGLGQWADPLSNGGLHFRFVGSGKSPEGGPSYRVDLDFGTGSQSPLQGTSTTWDTVNITGPVPLGATMVTVTLTCMAGALTACGARFDGLALSLVYPPPS